MSVRANRYSCGTAALGQVALLLTLFGGSGFAPAAAQGNRLEARVDALFADWDLRDSPGCALGLVQDGRLIYERGYGMANLDYDIPISEQTVFYVGSVSKQFTAAAVALLAQQRTIGLDDDIRTYLPEIREYERPITIRHLIHHTSGIRDIYTLMSLAGLRLDDVFTDDAAIDLIAGQRELNFAPGDKHLYSNSGYFLLAQIVKRATGTSLRQYAEENMFASLGMTNTHFHDTPNHILKNRAISYQRRENGRFRISYLSNFDKVGAGGLYTTVQDLLRWDQNFYSGEVGGREFLAQIQTPGMLNDGSTLAYAFGLTAGEHRGLSTVGHGGSMMGFRAAWLQFPEQHFSVICLCNLGSINPSRLAQRAADIYLADHFAEAETRGEPSPDRRPPNELREVALDAAQLGAYAGVYFSPELNVTYHIVVEDGALLVKRRNSPDSELVPTGEDTHTFRGRVGTFLFERGDQGNVTAFTVNAGRVTNIRFTRTGG